MAKRTKKSKPPIRLANWIEKNIVLGDAVAEPGPMKLWPFQREFANALSDEGVEQVAG